MEIEGQFALREILFVLQKKSVNARPIANDLFDPPKFSQFRQLALELWRPTIFCRARKSIVPWQIPFNLSSYFVIDTRLNGIMYECFLIERSLLRVLVSCRLTLFPFSNVCGKRLQGSYAGVDFEPGFYRSEKCPIRVKTTAASTSVEQLS